MSLVNPLSRNAPQCALYLFFTCLTPDDFTRQWGQARSLMGYIMLLLILSYFTRSGFLESKFQEDLCSSEHYKKKDIKK
jgi:hypothetical protein